MKIDTVVLWIIAVLAGIVGLIYFAMLVFGSIATGGMLLPGLAIFLAVVVVFAIVLKDRLSNREDDYYDKIEK